MIVLDTHTLLWWVSDQSKLSSPGRRAINRESKRSGGLLVSSISTWEIAMLVARSRLTLRVELDELIAQLEKIEAIKFVPVNNKIALSATLLPEPLHKDPADRMIIATAKSAGCQLVTADRKILDYQHVETIW